MDEDEYKCTECSMKHCNKRYHLQECLEEHIVDEHNKIKHLYCWCCNKDYHLQETLDKHRETDEHKEIWETRKQYFRNLDPTTVRAEIPEVQAPLLGIGSIRVIERLEKLAIDSGGQRQMPIKEEEYDEMRHLYKEDSTKRRQIYMTPRINAVSKGQHPETTINKELENIHPSRRHMFSEPSQATPQGQERNIYTGRPPPQHGKEESSRSVQDPAMTKVIEKVKYQRKKERNHLQRTYNLFVPPIVGQSPVDFRTPPRRNVEHIRLQSELSLIGYTTKTKRHLQLPNDYDHQERSEISIKYRKIELPKRNTAVDRGNVIQTFGFDDDLVLLRHSRFYLGLGERDKYGRIIYNDEDELAYGIYPPRTGKREKYGNFSVPSDVMIEYRRHTSLRADGDMDGLPLPIVPRNRKGRFAVADFVKKVPEAAASLGNQVDGEVDGEVDQEVEDPMDIDSSNPLPSVTM